MPSLGARFRFPGSSPGASDLRYLLVTVAGYGIDLGGAVVALRLLGLPLVPAAMVGFVSAVIANYLAHEFWTYRHAKRWPVKARILAYMFGSLMTLAVRAVVILGIEVLLPDVFGPIATLVIAAGVSILFNFVFTKRLVFLEAASKRPAPDGLS